MNASNGTELAPELSIVIPVYNEASIVEGSLRELDARLRKLGRRFEILVVENGSKDDTATIVRMIPGHVTRRCESLAIVLVPATATRAW